MFQILTHVC